MKNFFLFFTALVLFSCGGNSGSGSAEGNETSADLAGKSIYELHCSICHGADGKLGAGGAKDLSASVLSLEERKKIITKGGNGMTPFDILLSEQDIESVAKYIESLRK